MKMIRAIVQPSRVDMIRDALEEREVTGLTTYQVQGHGRQKGHKEIYRGTEYMVHFLPKVAIEIVVPDKDVADVQAVVIQNARSGNIGDGKVFILNIEEATRIRTGETGESAL